MTFTLYGRTQSGQHIYSIIPQGEFAPKPTEVKILQSVAIPISDMIESNPVLIYDDAFEETLAVHENDFWIQQTFKIKPENQPGEYPLEGFILYQVCDQKICSLRLKKSFYQSIIIE